MPGEENISERKKQILKAIVEAHIEGGEPVGSKYITESRQLSCSSATIRNEMAELENMGYLEQPHTSAGRVPSKKGYRFYVDTLLKDYAMTTKEIAQINQLMKIKLSELDQILDKASKVASELTNYPGFVIKPREHSVTVQKFEATLIDKQSFILILVASNGAVKTRNILTENEVDEKTVARLSQSLNELAAGHTANEMSIQMIIELENRMSGDVALVNAVMKAIWEVLNELDSGELKVSGLDRLLQYPEFAEPENLGELLGALERKEDILDLVADPGDDRVNAVIGSDSSMRVMNNSTLVYKPVRQNGHTVGVIGVIGPLRMDYAKVLKTLDNLGENLTNLLAEPYNEKGEKGDQHDG